VRPQGCSTYVAFKRNTLFERCAIEYRKVGRKSGSRWPINQTQQLLVRISSVRTMYYAHLLGAAFSPRTELVAKKRCPYTAKTIMNEQPCRIAASTSSGTSLEYAPHRVGWPQEEATVFSRSYSMGKYDLERMGLRTNTAQQIRKLIGRKFADSKSSASAVKLHDIFSLGKPAPSAQIPFGASCAETKIRVSCAPASSIKKTQHLSFTAHHQQYPPTACPASSSFLGSPSSLRSTLRSRH
jgi:hypothetical protein